MARYEMELRNVPRFRVMQYLEEIGGQRPTPDALRAEGDGWAAWLEEMPPVQITVMSIRRDMLIIEGSDPETEPIYNHMRQRTMRGGG